MASGDHVSQGAMHRLQHVLEPGPTGSYQLFWSDCLGLVLGEQLGSLPAVQGVRS